MSDKDDEMTDNDMSVPFALDDTDDDGLCEICGGAFCGDGCDLCEDLMSDLQ